MGILLQLGDNCIQNVHLGVYIVGRMVRNIVIQCAFPCISDYIPPLMKILNIVIPILMNLYSFVSHWSVASGISSKEMYNAGYTVADFDQSDVASQKQEQ